jgi:hypothetical protein
VLLYVSFDGKEIFVNELGSLLIGIRLDIQPSTSSSSRSRAEIQQDGTGLPLCGGEGFIDVLTPIHAHVHLLDNYRLEFQLDTVALAHRPPKLSGRSVLYDLAQHYWIRHSACIRVRNSVIVLKAVS